MVNARELEKMQVADVVAEFAMMDAVRPVVHEVQVIWAAFTSVEGGVLPTWATIKVADGGAPFTARKAEVLLDLLFEQTNLYRGSLWDQLQVAGLPEGRTHTALSVGDFVRVDDVLWRLEPLGWVVDRVLNLSQGA